MKMKPILFSTPMVQAILNGTKTQTRRVAIPVEDKQFQGGFKFGKNPGWCSIDYPAFATHSPYGVKGDILWVRETFYAWGKWSKDGFTKSGKQKWKFIDSGFSYRYEDSKPGDVNKNSFREEG